MRYVTLMVLLSGAAVAQSQNWSQPNLQQYFKQFKMPLGKTAPAPKVELAPGQPCAIPLLNALKKETTNDKMVHLLPPSKEAKIVTVSPPAPSCDDVR